MAHEKEVFEEVATTRSRAVDANQQAGQAPGDPQAVSALAGAEGALTGALGRLFAVMENYPDLKASRNAAQLQEDLTNTENKVAFARQAYNDAVMRYNNARQAFPAVVIAGPLGFRDAAFLEFEDAAMQKPPKVQF
jgi:LemA protein